MKRNGVVFKQQDLDAETLYYAIKWRIGLWSKAWKEETPYSAADLARNFESLRIIFP